VIYFRHILAFPAGVMRTARKGFVFLYRRELVRLTKYEISDEKEEDIWHEK
jgi:hypothetical protein